MTLLIARRCTNGVVLVTDSRMTIDGQGKSSSQRVTKVYKVKDDFLLAWSGSQSISQAFALRFQESDISTTQSRLEIEKKCRAIIQELKAAGYGDDYGEWLLAWWSVPDEIPVLLHLLSERPGEWVEDWKFAGNQDVTRTARLLSTGLRFFPRSALTLEPAKVLALKVMRDTLEVGHPTIGGEAQLGTVSKIGVRVPAGTDLQAVHDTLDALESQWAEALVGDTQVPADTTTPDAGVSLF